MTPTKLAQIIERLDRGEQIPFEQIPIHPQTKETYLLPDSLSYDRLMNSLKDFDLVADTAGLRIHASNLEYQIVTYVEGDVTSMKFTNQAEYLRGLARLAAFYAQHDRAVYHQIARYCKTIYRERDSKEMEL